MKNNLVNDVRLIQGSFLVATPLLLDPLFEKSIVFITEFKEYASYGFLVDYPLQNSNLLQDVKKKLEGTIFEFSDIFLGGPVDPNTFFLVHSNDLFCNRTLQVSDNISISSLNEALKNFSCIPSFYKIFAGYCSWKVGQLEEEIKRGNWLLKDFSNNIMFLNSKKKWKNLMESFCHDFKKFSLNSGVA